MEKSLIFSVLVPVYNVEKYLNQCIESVLAQSYRYFELILLNDGSTDSSGMICEKWAEKDERIRVIHRENKGLFQTRLDEIDVAEGDYLIFVDSDDFIKPELLQTVYSLIQKYNADIVTYGREIVDLEGRCVPYPIQAYKNETVFNPNNRSEILARSLYNNDITSIWSKCIKKNLLQPITKQLRKYGRLNMGEDAVFSTWIFSRYSLLVYTDFPLYCYRRDGSGMSTYSSFERFNDTIICSKARYDAILTVKSEINNQVIRIYWEQQWHGRIYYLKSYLAQGISKKNYSFCYMEEKKILKDSIMDVKILGYRVIYYLFNPKFYCVLRKVFNNDNS